MTDRKQMSIIFVMSAPEPTLTSPSSWSAGSAGPRRKAGEDWIRERELSHEQGFVLGYLVQNPGAIQRDIAAGQPHQRGERLEPPAGARARGLVERRTEGGDERSKRVYATPAGSELIAGFDTAMAAADETILAPLDHGRAGHPARPAHEDHRGAAATHPVRNHERAARAAPAAPTSPSSPRRRPSARARTCPEKEQS